MLTSRRSRSNTQKKIPWRNRHRIISEGVQNAPGGPGPNPGPRLHGPTLRVIGSDKYEETVIRGKSLLVFV